MRVYLENDILKAEFDTFGAELKSVMNKTENREYMWYGNPRFWGRTSPVLFPFVGSLKEKRFLLNGKAWPMGQHGFARDHEHTLISNSGTELRFAFESSEATLAKFPFAFRLETVYTLSGCSLSVRWEVTNPGSEALPFSIGAHPAFLCPIHGESSKAGYRLCFDGVEKIRHHGNSRKTGLSVKEDLTLTLENGKALITPDFFDRCTYMIEGNQCSSVGLEDPEGRRFITVKFNTPLFAVWSPEEKNAPFVCIEPWYGRTDAEDFEGDLYAREYQQLLAPADTFTGGYEMLFG